jgi:hypothetical protein
MMSKEKENVEGGPMSGPLFIDKDNIIAKGGIWEASKVNIPKYRQMAVDITYDYGEGIEVWLKRGWFVKTMVHTNTGIVVVFERND